MNRIGGMPGTGKSAGGMVFGFGAAAGAALLFVFMVNAPRDGEASETPDSAASGWEDAGPARVRLIAAETVHDGEALLGVEIQLEKKWKTYWRYPGDSGLPPRFGWEGSENIAEAQAHWPAPEKFTRPDTTYGYKDHVIFPVRVTAEDADAPLKVELHFDFGICEDICVPAQAGLALHIEPGTRRESAEAPLIETWLARVPQDLAERGSQAEARLGSGGRSIELVLTGGKNAPPVLIADGPEHVYFGEASLEGLAGPYRYTIPVESPRDIAGETLHLTFLARGEAWQDTVVIAPETAP